MEMSCDSGKVEIPNWKYLSNGDCIRRKIPNQTICCPDYTFDNEHVCIAKFSDPSTADNMESWINLCNVTGTEFKDLPVCTATIGGGIEDWRMLPSDEPPFYCIRQVGQDSNNCDNRIIYNNEEVCKNVISS